MSEFVLSQAIKAKLVAASVIFTAMLLAGAWQNTSLQGHAQSYGGESLTLRPLVKQQTPFAYTAVSNSQIQTEAPNTLSSPTQNATPQTREPIFETPDIPPSPQEVTSDTPSNTSVQNNLPPNTIDPTLPVKTNTQTIYEALPAIWVFPVPNPTQGKVAFSDAAWSMAAEIAQQLAHKYPNTQIIYPTDGLATLKRRQPALLNRLWEQWLREGHFQPTALAHAVDTLSPDASEPAIARVVVVQADADINQPEKSWNLMDKLRTWHGDDIPNDTRLFLRSRLTVINTQSPTMETIWTGAWQHPIKRKHLGNMTASVYADSDSMKSFHDAGQVLGNVLLMRAPQASFQKPITVTTTQVVAKRGTRTTP